MSVNSHRTKAPRVKLCLIHQRQPSGVGTQVRIAAADFIIYEASWMRRAARSDAGRDELSRRSLSAHKRLHFSGIFCGRYIKVRRSYNHTIVKVNTSTVIQDFSIIAFFSIALTWHTRQLLLLWFLFSRPPCGHEYFQNRKFSLLDQSFVFLL